MCVCVLGGITYEMIILYVCVWCVCVCEGGEFMDKCVTNENSECFFGVFKSSVISTTNRTKAKLVYLT